MNPTKKQKLKEILLAIKGESIDFSAFDKAVGDFRKQLTQQISIPSVDKVATQLQTLKKDLNLDTILGSITEVRADLNKKINTLSNLLSEAIKEQELNLKESETKSDINLNTEINSLRVQISALDIVEHKELDNLEAEIKKLADTTTKTLQTLDKSKELETINETVKNLRLELLNKISEKGGGNMNRQIYFNSTNYLKKYTDINWKAGTNVTFTVVDNNVTKKVDITVSATGGSGSGIVRSITSISGDTAADSAATTDYVYLCTGTLTLTLPDATTNTNLYTIKNVGNGIVTIATTSSQTIDGDLTVIMPVRYTSVDLVSDTANWNVT